MKKGHVSRNALRRQKQEDESQKIELPESWIESQKPDPGSNPLSFPAPPTNGPVGRVGAGLYSPYAGWRRFDQLPISQDTKHGLGEGKYTKMTEIQRASLPHSLCGRDVLGAAKTGSGKTLAFVIPVLEKLYMEKWTPEAGVGGIIISPTGELAGQLFDVLNVVGKYHCFSAGLLIGGRKEIDIEKEKVNDLNILVCMPGRLLQHMDETPSFDCSQLQVLVLDEADRILDVGFKKTLNAIISQLPKSRQTFLFSATQTKSVQDLARLSLKDPEYISVHQESVTATPSRLQQTAMIVPLEQRLDMLWSLSKFVLLNCPPSLFLQSDNIGMELAPLKFWLSWHPMVKFVFEAFKKLRPGIPLKCLHGRMKQDKRMGIYSEFCEKRSVLFFTDVAARGLDFNKAVNWVVQVDCPEDVASYIHRVGRTARYHSGGRSVLFLTPSEMKMLEKLKEAKVPLQFIKANTKRLQPVSGLLSALLVKYPDFQNLAKRAFITYLRSIYIQKDKDIFDVSNLSVDELSASFGLPMTPKIRFLSRTLKSQKLKAEHLFTESDKNMEEADLEMSKDKLSLSESEEEENDIRPKEDIQPNDQREARVIENAVPATRVLKKKKLKISIHRPVGTTVVFDDKGNTLTPLARVAEIQSSDGTVLLDKDKKDEFYRKMREEMKRVDKEDKPLERQRRREKRTKEKTKLKNGRPKDNVDDEGESELSTSDSEAPRNKKHKKAKMYFDSDDDGEEKANKGLAGSKGDAISLAKQEALALNC